jgi:hypothetical protein
MLSLSWFQVTTLSPCMIMDTLFELRLPGVSLICSPWFSSSLFFLRLSGLEAMSTELLIPIPSVVLCCFHITTASLCRHNHVEAKSFDVVGRFLHNLLKCLLYMCHCIVVWCDLVWLVLYCSGWRATRGFWDRCRPVRITQHRTRCPAHLQHTVTVYASP